MGQISIGAHGSESAMGPAEQRYFYGLRTDEEGTLYFTRTDQWTSSEAIQINRPGDGEEDFEGFEVGIDHFDGKDPDTHERPYENLVFDQYRFDSKSIFYYINSAGELVARINQVYDYPTDV
jgi:hypothetical protein